MKKTLIILGCAASVLCLLLLACYINHRVCLDRERALLSPIGQRVEVEGGSMNVYTEGAGEKTLVFMSGGGTCSPVLDFRSLYSLLSDEYRVAVVEKFGYGFSDVVADAQRDIDSVLECTRAALSAVGIDGPYVLCPHSMSGIEALYWAQKYPDEVSAIIGLDMAVPSAYRDYPISMAGIRLGQFAARAGIIRLLPGVAESDAIKYGTLTEEEKDIYRAVFYSRTATANMIEEVRCIKRSAALVEQGDVPQIPMLLFLSDGKGTGMERGQWVGHGKDFAALAGDCRVVELDCPHYVHDYEYRRISGEIKSFLG